MVFFVEENNGMKEKPSLIENDLGKLVTSLEGESLAFRLYEAKECRQKGDFNKAMLLVSEIVRDHIISLRAIQNIIDSTHKREERKVIFQKFRQWEPFEVGLTNAPDVIMIVDEFMAPWEKENYQLIEEYLELEKKINYENKKSEVLKRIIDTSGSIQEVEEQIKIISELSQRQEVLRFKLAVEIICLTEKIQMVIAPELNGYGKDKLLMKLPIHLGTIMLSSIITKSAEYVEAENK